MEQERELGMEWRHGMKAKNLIKAPYDQPGQKAERDANKQRVGALRHLKLLRRFVRTTVC